MARLLPNIITYCKSQSHSTAINLIGQVAAKYYQKLSSEGIQQPSLWLENSAAKVTTH